MPPAPVLGEPSSREQPCDVCQQTVRILVTRTPDGSPDFVRALFPDSAWLGWTWANSTDQELSLIVLCSQTCLVEWFDLEHGVGA